MMSRRFPRLTAIFLAGAMSALIGAGVEVARAQSAGPDEIIKPNGVEQTLDLTAAQKSAIYRAVSRDKRKVAPTPFATTVGAEVPPMIELYTLPDGVLANNPVVQFFRYTVVQDQVVLVDPTNMRVSAVIGPKQGQ